MVSAGQHHIIKDAGETIGHLLQESLQQAGYKRIHILNCAPKSDAIEGKLPALCIYLYNLTVDYEGTLHSGGERYIESTTDARGEEVDVERTGPMWVRLDYLVSAWAQTPEEEHLLIGGALKSLLENPVLRDG